MDKDTMQKALTRRFFVVITPALLVLGGWAAYRNLVEPTPPIEPKITGPAAFIAAVVFAIALPLLGRDRFVKRVAKEQFVPPETFLAFELSNMTLGLVSAYFAAAAYVCAVSQFHFGGAFLAALYAAYYYFPTNKRMAHEMRLFRVPVNSGDSRKE